MTLLEIMIVLAIIALVMGLVVGPAVMNHFTRSKKEITQMKIQKYAHEAYPAWAATSGKSCPDQLADLNAFTNSKGPPTDSWDRPLVMTCGASNPPGVVGIGVRSHGEDGVPDTADDLVSWK